MKRLNFFSLRFRLIVLVLIGVIPALGLLIEGGVRQRRLVATMVQNNALRMAHLAALQEVERIESTRYLLIGMAEHPDILVNDHNRSQSMLRRILREHPAYANFGVIDLRGRLLCSAVPADPIVDFSQREVFRRALAKRDFSMGEWDPGRLIGRPSFTFGYPILDEKKKPVAVVYASLDLKEMNRALMNIHLLQGGSASIIDQHGQVLVRYPDREKLVGRNMSTSPVVQHLRRREGTMRLPGIDGVPRLFAYVSLDSPASPSSLYLLIGVPAKQAFTEVDRMFMSHLLGLGSAALLALLAAWFGGDFFILRRLRALVAVTRRLQAGDLGARTGVIQMTDELDQLAWSFDQMAATLQSRVAEREYAQRELKKINEDLEQRVKDRARELFEKNRQMEVELDLARDLQQAFLPRQPAVQIHPAQFKNQSLRVYYRYHPTGMVGGDFFDVLTLSESKAGVFICDVMGRGVRAALVTAIMRGLVEELKPIATDAGRFLSEINRGLLAILKQTETSMFVTAFYLIADMATGRMQFANAGHPSPIHLRRKQGVVELLHPMDSRNEPALGLVDNFAYPTREHSLNPEDLVILFTDGLYEVDGPADEEYGPHRLLMAVRRRIGLPPDKLLDEILDEAQHFSNSSEFSDDVCLVGLEMMITNGKKK